MQNRVLNRPIIINTVLKNEGKNKKTLILIICFITIVFNDFKNSIWHRQYQVLACFDAQFSPFELNSSFEVVYRSKLPTIRKNLPDKYPSIGFKSGETAGQFITLILWSLNHLLVLAAE